MRVDLFSDLYDASKVELLWPTHGGPITRSMTNGDIAFYGIIAWLENNLIMNVRQPERAVAAGAICLGEIRFHFANKQDVTVKLFREWVLIDGKEVAFRDSGWRKKVEEFLQLQ